MPSMNVYKIDRERWMKQMDFLGKEPIFIIGYPKSGNTWLARLISDAFSSPIVGGDNPIDQADKKQSYTGQFLIYKSHYSKQSKPDYIKESSKILYIVRDFRDVLVSGFFHNHRGANEYKYTIENTLDLRFHSFYRYYFVRQVDRMIRKWQGSEITVFRNNIKKFISILKYFVLREKWPTSLSVGNWSEHVSHWIELPNACVIRYEDLLADTFATLKKSFSKIKISCSDQRLFEAIERQSFKTRKKEFQKKGDQVNTVFMRKGVAGDWKRFLDEKMIQHIKKAHGPTMNRLGYEI